MPELVDEDQESEPDDGDEDRHASTSLRSASRRASASAVTRSARSRAGDPSTASRAPATVSAISRNPIRPSRNASTATSFAALYAHGVVPPRSPAARASARSGNVSSSTASKRRSSPLREVERRCWRRRSVGVPERERDRDAHVGVPEMGEERAVAKPDERMNDRRWVHDDLDALVRHAKEPVRLDQLEPLVGESGGVHTDLSSHRPGRMGRVRRRS